jgi:hypothetical protein
MLNILLVSQLARPVAGRYLARSVCRYAVRLNIDRDCLEAYLTIAVRTWGVASGTIGGNEGCERPQTRGRFRPVGVKSTICF